MYLRFMPVTHKLTPGTAFNVRELPVIIWVGLFYSVAPGNVILSPIATSTVIVYPFRSQPRHFRRNFFAPQVPLLEVNKSASLKGLSAVGETVGFTISVTNGGNVDLVNVTLTDAMFRNAEGESTGSGVLSRPVLIVPAHSASATCDSQVFATF